MDHIEMFVIVVIACLIWQSEGAGARSKKTSLPKSGQDELINRLLLKYTKQDPPSSESATVVQLGIYVNSFYSISEATMDYMLSFYLRQRWIDTRLAYPNETNSKLRQIKLGEAIWEKLWIPDTFFRNEKKANFHDVTVPNRMIQLKQDGTLWYVTKISATFSCQMKLQKYPLDTQVCSISIESFGYTSDIMDFAWLVNEDDPERPAIDIGDNRQLPQFTLERFTQKDCSQNYSAGRFPCLEVGFVLRRDIGFFLIQVYVPSILIVILSWVSFWINIESSPARVSIGLLTVLTTTTMSAGARASLPRVSYIKAIDIWMIVCLIFVFTSLIEYAVVNVMSRKQPSKKSANPTDKERKLLCNCAKDTDIRQVCKCFKKCNLMTAKTESDGKRKARNIDKLSRQCFPLAFILFNVVYWTVYTFPSSDSVDVDGA